MKILAVADEQCPALYDYCTPDRLRDYDLILSCGDLRPKYLSFLVTMARCPLLYIHGNHDARYENDPPEGCDCIEDMLVVYKGLRILGLGGCRQYRPGAFQYTEQQMRRRILKLRWKLWWHKGVDVVITHAPPEGVGDLDDAAHKGFAAFLELIDRYHPQYLIHGHVHLRYGMDQTRVRHYGGTQVVNASERWEFEIPDDQIKPTKKKGDLRFV